MERIIIILSDNRTDTPLLGTEHGLSAYTEYGGRRYLLDTGASDLFMLNAEKLGVDLGEVDYCLISHGPLQMPTHDEKYPSQTPHYQP